MQPCQRPLPVGGPVELVPATRWAGGDVQKEWRHGCGVGCAQTLSNAWPAVCAFKGAPLTRTGCIKERKLETHVHTLCVIHNVSAMQAAPGWTCCMACHEVRCRRVLQCLGQGRTPGQCGGPLPQKSLASKQRCSRCCPPCCLCINRALQRCQHGQIGQGACLLLCCCWTQVCSLRRECDDLVAAGSPGYLQLDCALHIRHHSCPASRLHAGCVTHTVHTTINSRRVNERSRINR